MDMNKTEKERLAVVETKITNIHEDVKEIKAALAEHVKWEEEKYNSFEKRFANKWVEKAFIAILLIIITAVATAITTLF